MPINNPYSPPAPKLDGDERPQDQTFRRCVRCGSETQCGFTLAPGSWYPNDRVGRLVSIPKPIWPIGFLAQMVMVRLKYFRAFLCQGCGCYVVDSSEMFTGHQARRIARLDPTNEHQTDNSLH